MTENKPIMVDEVDVAECQYLYFAIEDNIIDCKEYPRCSIGEAFTNNACKNSNCYFKQLARKNQECEELKKDRINIIKENAKDYRKLQQAEQKLKRIRDIAEPYKMTIKKICKNCEKYDSCHACCYKDISCYKYTSPNAKSCDEFTYLDKLIPNIISNQILQIIDEVEE